MCMGGRKLALMIENCPFANPKLAVNVIGSLEIAIIQIGLHFENFGFPFMLIQMVKCN
jgi:hypothetical protein